MKKHLLNVLALVIGICIYGWGVWQHDVLVAPRISDFYTGNFEFFTGIRSSVGFAYNITLLIQTIGVILLPLAIWFWEDEPLTEKENP